MNTSAAAVAPITRAKIISRTKPRIRLTSVSPPIVPPALSRFMRLAPRLLFGRRGLASGGELALGLAAAGRLGGLDLLHEGRAEVDRLEQQRREAGVLDR